MSNEIEPHDYFYETSQGLCIIGFYQNYNQSFNKVDQLLDEVDDEIGAECSTYTADIDQYPGLRDKLDLSIIPTYIIYQEGSIVKILLGEQSKEDILDTLGDLI